ncbi:hypothetical protein C8Q79DRAFT_1007084 [Trametes meyenii]|nr:hypothetical protein C8Q79DRAFT_1007084 [Trametes meyenii]
MYVYNGKLAYYNYAKDECITIVFPAGFALEDPVCAYWQWTEDAKGNKKANECQLGTISSVAKTEGVYKFVLSFSYYYFEGSVSADLNAVTVMMREPRGFSSSIQTTLQAQLSDVCCVPSTEVFTGKLNFLDYAVDEMITLVIPNGIADGEPVGMYWEWTKDGQGRPKQNHCVNSTFRGVVTTGGETKGTFDDGYYTYQAVILSDDQHATLHMRNPVDDRVLDVNMEHTDFRQAHAKKALIIRYGTGTDNGIFLVREMLTKHLGFDTDDVEMLYFNDEPKGKPAVRSDGQAAPTASNFKAKFTRLIVGARGTGDVRFVYVDTHGTIYPNPDGSGEPDGIDEGWTMAEDDDGTRKEIVYDNWLAQAINTNLKVGVNLTILTSSCMGGGMLDTQTATAGVLLAGCHETQFNVKSLRTKDGMVDPWMYAIVSVIKNQVKRKRGVPTYVALFDDAKKYIKAQLDAGAIGEKYKGPSPNELEPIARGQVSNTSHQDPQLVFYDGYFDPDAERFLFPFVGPRAGNAEGESARFPKDQYPHGGEL